MRILCLLLLIGGGEAKTCKTVWKNLCSATMVERCDTVHKPQSVVSSNEECNTWYYYNCTTVYDNVETLDKKECKTVKVPKQEYVPFRICETKCDTKYEETCHTEFEKECSTKNEEECEILHEKVCDTSIEYKTDIKKEKRCHLETETQCHDTPSTDCQTVKKPVTKYRDEEECRTVYDQVCVPSYDESCHTVTERQCKTVTETECDHNNRCWDEERDECWDEPKQECKQTPKEVCNNIPRQKCTTVQHPYTDEDKQDCNTLNKPVCRQVPVYKCYDVDTPVDHLVPGSKCQNQAKKVCKSVPKQDCKDVLREKCQSVPKLDCQTPQTQDCRIEYNQITSYVEKEECETTYRKISRKVCDKVPKRECKPVPVSETTYKATKVCYNATMDCRPVYGETCAGPSLFLFQIEPNKHLEICRQDFVLSCHAIFVDVDVLGEDELEIGSPLHQIVKLTKAEGVSNHTYHYGNDDMDMVFNYNSHNQTVTGHIVDKSNNQFYVLKNQPYIIAPFSYENHFLVKTDPIRMGGSMINHTLIAKEETMLKDVYHNSMDNETIAYFSVKVYYERKFQDETESNVEKFVDQVIEETNMGFKNSHIPIRIYLHCLELAPIFKNEAPTYLKLPQHFRIMKGSVENLLGSADLAMLISEDVIPGAFGVALGHTAWVVRTFAASPHWIFAHEIGHTFGSSHEYVFPGVNAFFEDGFGYVIPKGHNTSDFHTIMSTGNAPYRLNYWSNPHITANETGTPIGILGRANNARLITQERFRIANVGDESVKCCRFGSFNVGDDGEKC